MRFMLSHQEQSMGQVSIMISIFYEWENRGTEML